MEVLSWAAPVEGRDQWLGMLGRAAVDGASAVAKARVDVLVPNEVCVQLCASGQGDRLGASPRWKARAGRSRAEIRGAADRRLNSADEELSMTRFTEPSTESKR